MSLHQDGGDEADIWPETSLEAAHMENVAAASSAWPACSGCLPTLEFLERLKTGK